MKKLGLSAALLWKQKKPEIFCGFLCSLSVIFVATILVRRHLYVQTTYAFLQAYTTQLAPRISGEVISVNVHENQAVLQGEVLCTIDDRSYQNALRDAENQREALSAQWRSAQSDYLRAAFLFRQGAITTSQRDAAWSAVHSFQAQYEAAEARVSTAKLKLSYTRVSAPVDGFIAFKSAQLGMFASPGVPLFGFVPNQDRWIEAKIKETDLSGIRIGDHAKVKFDAIPHQDFSGILESIGAATESPFSSVPDDFAAGNFTKYAQWVPVRIRLAIDPQKIVLPIGTNSDVQFKRRRS